MGLYRFGKSASVVKRVIVAMIVLMLGSAVVLAQTKPERQSKATKASEAKPSSTTSHTGGILATR